MLKIKNIFHNTYSNPIYVFIIFATIFGIFSALITPPFDKPDESANFIRAYGISNGEFYVNAGKTYPGYDIHGVRQDGHTNGTVTMPTSYRESRECLGIGGSYPWMSIWFEGQEAVDTSQSYKDASHVIHCLVSTPLDEAKTEHLVGNAGYSPLSYIPQAVAILIGKIFDAPIIIMSYLVRLFNLALWITLIAFAIRLVPKRKWALAAICLFPAFTFSMTHATPDATLFGAIALSIATIVRSIHLQPKQLREENKKLLSILSVSSVVMVLAKSSYGVLFLPLLLFYGGLKKYWVIKLISILLLATLSFSPINNWITGETPPPPPAKGLGMILTEFPKTIASQLINGDRVSSTMFTGALILPTLPQSWIVMFATILLALILAVDYEDSRKKLKLAVKNRERLLLIATGIIVSCLVFCGALFLLWQQFGFVRPVPLVPGRYFLSILMLFAILPILHKISTTEAYYKKICVFGLLILNMLVIMSYIYGRYL